MIIEVKVFILIILVNFDKVAKFSLDLIFLLGLLEILTPKFISVIGLQRIHGESFFVLEMTEVPDDSCPIEKHKFIGKTIFEPIKGRMS